MTFFGQAPIVSAICPPNARPTARRHILATAAVSLLALSAASAVSAAPWTMSFEDEVTVGDGLVTHGEAVGNMWRTTALPGSGVNVMISAYDRSSTGLPPGVNPAVPASMPSFTVGTGAVSSSGRKAVAFDTEQVGTPDLDMQVYSSSSNRSSDIRQGFRYASSVEARPAGTDSKHRPGNVLVLDNTANTGTETNDNGGLFLFQFSAPVTLSSLDVFDQTYNESTYQDKLQISFYNAAGAEIYVTPGSVNIADALLPDGNGNQQLYLPYTGDNRWRRLTFNIENVRTMTIGCKYECAIDNLRGQVTTQTVPEPAPLALLGMGLLGLMAIRRRLT